VGLHPQEGEEGPPPRRVNGGGGGVPRWVLEWNPQPQSIDQQQTLCTDLNSRPTLYIVPSKTSFGTVGSRARVDDVASPQSSNYHEITLRDGWA
jgi:hypothetical protein